MTELQIEIPAVRDAEPGGPRRIALRVDDLAFTRLLRPREPEPDDYLVAPPAQLAFWLVDNWWRIRWEGIPPAGMTADWRLAHEMSAIGGGYAWPRLAIWGEGNRVGFLSRSDPPGVVGPVRFLSNALVYADTVAFDRTIDEFLLQATDAYVTDADRPALLAQFDALRAERDDAEVATWRRMEARLGFDTDEAPDAVIEALAAFADAYGAAGVEEAAMAMPGAQAAQALETEIEAARQSKVECRFGAALHVLGPTFRHGDAPWKLAERAASSLRSALGCNPGPLSNAELGKVLATRRNSFRTVGGILGAALPYGLRLAIGDGDLNRVAVRSRWSVDRRFELARALGDAVWTASDNDRLGPLAASKSARQKFQRAFAQSLLCPYEDLITYIDTVSPTDGDFSAAARHFYVSERVVRTVLVNKGLLDRHRLERLTAQALEPERLGELVDAA